MPGDYLLLNGYKIFHLVNFPDTTRRLFSIRGFSAILVEERLETIGLEIGLNNGSKKS